MSKEDWPLKEIACATCSDLCDDEDDLRKGGGAYKGREEICDMLRCREEISGGRGVSVELLSSCPTSCFSRVLLEASEEAKTVGRANMWCRNLIKWSCLGRWNGVGLSLLDGFA